MLSIKFDYSNNNYMVLLHRSQASWTKFCVGGLKAVDFKTVYSLLAL